MTRRAVGILVALVTRGYAGPGGLEMNLQPVVRMLHLVALVAETCLMTDVAAAS